MLVGWAAHKEIIVPVGKFPADGRAFDMPVMFVGDPEIAANVSASGADIRASLPDGTIIDYEIVRLDAAAGNLLIIVSVPASDGVTASIIHIDVGNALAVDAQNPAGVFSDYTARGHCAGDPTGIVAVPDSSPTANNGNIVGTLLPARTLSPLGLGYFDDGAGNEVDWGANGFNPYLYTCSWWHADATGAATPLNLCGTGGGAEDVCRFGWDETVPAAAWKHDWGVSGVSTVTLGGWHRHTITYDDATTIMIHYEDGVELSRGSGANIPVGVVGAQQHWGARSGSAGAMVWDIADYGMQNYAVSAARELAYFQSQTAPSAFYSESAWLPNVVIINTITETFNLSDGTPFPNGTMIRAYDAVGFPASAVDVGGGSVAGGSGVAQFTINISTAVILIADQTPLGGEAAISLPILPIVT